MGQVDVAKVVFIVFSVVFCSLSVRSKEIEFSRDAKYWSEGFSTVVDFSDLDSAAIPARIIGGYSGSLGPSLIPSTWIAPHLQLLAPQGNGLFPFSKVPTDTVICPEALGLNFDVRLVDVGDPGNQANGSGGKGDVDYAYKIGITEITNEQYAYFLNSVASIEDTYGLFDQAMEDSVHGGIRKISKLGGTCFVPKENMGSKPVNFVTFFDVLRFLNWLENGEPGFGGLDPKTQTDIQQKLDRTI